MTYIMDKIGAKRAEKVRAAVLDLVNEHAKKMHKEGFPYNEGVQAIECGLLQATRQFFEASETDLLTLLRVFEARDEKNAKPGGK